MKCCPSAKKKIVFLPSYPGLNTHTLKSTLQYLVPYCPFSKSNQTKIKLCFPILFPTQHTHLRLDSLWHRTGLQDYSFTETIRH
jgi:hypothetical protein